MPLYREDLESIPCGDPDCPHTGAEHQMRPRPVCHPDALLEACYQDGELTLLCGECEEVVAEIAVALREQYDAREVLIAHCSVLSEALNKWPPMAPSEAVTDLRVGEHSVMQHIDEVVASIRGSRLRGGKTLQ